MRFTAELKRFPDQRAGMTLIDAGLPGSRWPLERYLAGSGAR